MINGVSLNYSTKCQPIKTPTNCPTFGNLRIGYTVSERLAKKSCPKSYKKTLADLKRLIKAHGWNKQEHVDIILNSEKNYFGPDRFTCLISSKKQGTPHNPHNQCVIANDKKSIESFDAWIKEWNECYSPEGLAKLKKLQEFAFQELSKLMKRK